MNVSFLVVNLQFKLIKIFILYQGFVVHKDITLYRHNQQYLV